MFKNKSSLLLGAIISTAAIACQPPNLTSDSEISTSKVSSSKVISPPMGISAPPLGMTGFAGKILFPSQVLLPSGLLSPSRLLAPSQILSPSLFNIATTIQNVLLPPAWALDADHLSKLMIQMPDGNMSKQAVIQNPTSIMEGTEISMDFYIPGLTAQESTKPFALMTPDGKSTVLRVWPPLLAESEYMISDFCMNNTSVALIKEQNPELTFAAIRESQHRQPLVDAIKKALDSDAQSNINVKNDPAMIALAQEAAVKIAQETPISVEEVSIEPQTLTLKPGQTSTAKSIVVLTDGNANRPSSVIWSSSNPQVAMIDAKGNITAYSAGNVTFKVRSEADPSKSATLIVKVEE